jgi:hypothetical protein
MVADTKRWAVGVALVAVFAPARSRAQDRTYRIDLSGAYFVEPAPKQALHVFHPQASALLDLARWLSLSMGYDADVVSGATPRAYGGPLDAVSGATQFSDVRHAFHGGVEVRMGKSTVDVGYTYAFESDYRSHEIDASARVDLWGKNTTFRLDYARNFDSVCDADNRGAAPLGRRSLSTSTGCFNPQTTGIVTEPLAIDSYAAAWTQVLTPILLSELSVGYQILEGFQSNPYRLVHLFSGTVEAQESEPLLRQRVAVQARVRVALRKMHGALGVTGRFYWDSWGIKSGTAEVAWEQYVVPQVLFRLRGRFYQQGRAAFYRDSGESLSYDAVGPVGQYFTGDRELSPFRDYLWGIKLSYLKAADERGKILHAFEGFDLNGKVDVISYQALTPHPPNEARTNSLFGAIIAQVSLTLRW